MLQADSENANPVYFLAASSYGVRNRNQYCYPVDTTENCSGRVQYRKCRSTSDETSSSCIESSQDLILPDVNFELSNSDQTDQQTLIDLTQHLLRHKFMPQEELPQ